MNSALLTPTADFLNLSYRTDIGVLTARWLRSVTLAELQAGFQQVRQHSLAHSATHWLVDVRRRTELDATSSGWVVRELLPAAAQDAAPATLHIAYLLAPTREALLRTDSDMQATTMAAESPTQPYRLRTFIQEGLAMQWLLGQPA
ncbi:hypothetical protein HNQ93_001916 [Hymenobacter luteus]|uniref:Uncharacterized protein n=2 Tax=Hymenobacter TaxID=89966 RepID=A0A7W9T173_9BACT|nr:MULTISPECIES: hypothetical protein [Hymenobacter]MBB4600723.1 hypothetical protein [Hymenobacter latericoloratus]MBB6059070.1 hypothetical protein [Hymenobacter luteus]